MFCYITHFGWNDPTLANAPMQQNSLWIPLVGTIFVFNRILFQFCITFFFSPFFWDSLAPYYQAQF
jgi:hypothetical protein